MYLRIREYLSYKVGGLYLRLRGIKAKRVSCLGIPELRIFSSSQIKLEESVTLISNWTSTAIRLWHPLNIHLLTPTAVFKVGARTGISGGCFCAATEISIGSDCLIGANVSIYDTDFHPIAPAGRRTAKLTQARSKPVIIGNNVFIGAGAVILKGVTVGDNSVVGAGSVVSKDIPSSTVWAGNPARFVRDLTLTNK